MPFLLERLATRPAAMDGKPEAFDELAAIQAQIQRLFAHRSQRDERDSALMAWGLPGVVELGRGDKPALVKFAEQARRLIAEHEPRLKDVMVTVEPCGDSLQSFQLLITASHTASGEVFMSEFSLTH